MAALTTNTVSVGAVEYFNPWPDPAPPGGAVYDQKVWDTGGGGRWCYYTQNQSNPGPVSGDTSPNWSGTISTHVVIRVRT